VADAAAELLAAGQEASVPDGLALRPVPAWAVLVCALAGAAVVTVAMAAAPSAKGTAVVTVTRIRVHLFELSTSSSYDAGQMTSTPSKVQHLSSGDHKSAPSRVSREILRLSEAILD